MATRTTTAPPGEIPSTTRALLQPDISSTTLAMTTLPVPTPQPNTDEHVIRVHAASICAGELLWPKLYPHPSHSLKTFIPIPCTDFAGTVITSPPSSPFHPGSAVYARTAYGRAGNARDYTIALTSELAFIPTHLSWIEAAAVPVSAETAWQALFIHGGLPPPPLKAPDPKHDNTTHPSKPRILVTAASGSAGAWTVQLAHASGATVIGTCGPHNIQFVHSLGASEVLDYTTSSLRTWAATGRKVDLVVDCSTSDSALAEAWYCVREGGALLSIYQPPENVRLLTTSTSSLGGEGGEEVGMGGKGKGEEEIAHDIKHVFFIMHSSGEQLGHVTALLERGAVRPVVDSVWPLEGYEEAFQKVEAGHCRGKVVFDMDL